MNEKDIRDRIAQFLKKTARTVVVPASMGLGLSSAGCEGHSLHGKAADAGLDVQKADVSTLAPDLGDDAAKNDLPQILVPYVIAMAPDGAADVAPDELEAQSLDADRDTSPVPLDVRADIIYPAPPYLLPPMAPDELPGGAQGTAPAPLSPPEKK